MKELTVAAERPVVAIRGKTLRGWGVSLKTRIEAAPGSAFLWLTAFYVFVFFVLSSFKLLWLDELITLHIARLAHVSDIWHALASGADPNPPLTHTLVHFSRLLFGEHEYALRLPAAVGYWVGLLSLFLYLRKRVPATWALGGSVLSMTMGAFEYSYESRSYGIFYGLAMLAFLGWTNSVDPLLTRAGRRLALGGMIFALAAGISTNYFAVLAFLPIAAGELTRTLGQVYEIHRRSQSRMGVARVSPWADSWQVWVALLIAATPLLLFRSMINHSIAQFAPHAWNKVSTDQVVDSYTQMVEVVLFPILVLCALSLAVRLLVNVCPVCQTPVRPRWTRVFGLGRDFYSPLVPAGEAVGILFLMAYPILGYLVASVHGGMLSPRFVIPVCFGFAIAGTMAAFHLAGERPLAGVVFLCLCSAWFITRECVVGYWYVEQKQCFYKVIDHLPEAELSVPMGAPIAIPDPLLALTFQHYAPAALVRRLVFPVDFPAIRAYRHDDSPEQNLWAGRNSLYTLPIVPLAAFEQATGKYLIVASDGNWLLEDLRDHRYPVERLGINTRAVAIGGFTPLARGTPVFYTSYGEDVSAGPLMPDFLPIPFSTASNLPDAE